MKESNLVMLIMDDIIHLLHHNINHYSSTKKHMPNLFQYFLILLKIVAK